MFSHCLERHKLESHSHKKFPTLFSYDCDYFDLKNLYGDIFFVCINSENASCVKRGSPILFSWQWISIFSFAWRVNRDFVIQWFMNSCFFKRAVNDVKMTSSAVAWTAWVHDEEFPLFSSFLSSSVEVSTALSRLSSKIVKEFREFVPSSLSEIIREIELAQASSIGISKKRDMICNSRLIRR